MTEFEPLQPLPQPRRAAELTPEAQHFEAFKGHWKQKESSRVAGVGYCPTKPHRLAVVSGTKVGLWQAGRDGSAEVASTVSKFKDLTQCVAWRSDGRLLLAGEAGGSCAVVEVETKKVLRRFRGHGDAVTCCAFATADRARVATGGRDGRLRLWDVATGDLVQTLDAHSDSMKVLVPGPGGPDGWITAGYDGKVRLWDASLGSARSGDAAAAKAATADPAAEATRCCVTTVDHGHPVEAGAVFPGGALFVSAGGTELKVWDLASGGTLLHRLADAHSKVITSVCLSADASILLTASFDGLAKVFRASDLDHAWTYRLTGPATCAAWRPDGQAFAVGLDDGTWVTRQLRAQGSGGAGAEAEGAADAKEGLLPGDEPERDDKKKDKRPYAVRKGHLRGLDAAPNSDDEVVDLPDRPHKKRQKELDFLFRKFEYRKAFEWVVRNGMKVEPSTLFAAIDELLQRGALVVALTEVGEDLCLHAIKWLTKSFTPGHSLQQHLFMETLHTLLDNNKCLQPPGTAQLVNAVATLEHKIAQELKVQEALMETSGMLKSVTTL